MTKLLAGAVVAILAGVGLALAMSAAPSSQAGAVGPMYMYLYYSDASQTVVVGIAEDTCLGGHTVVTGPVIGQQTQWVSTLPTGVCPGGYF